MFFTPLPCRCYGGAGRLRLLLGRHHLLGLGLVMVLCLTWAACAVALTSWQVFRDTLEREALPRLVPNYDRPYRYGEALLHPFKLLLTTLPWSLLALGTFLPAFYRLLDARGKFLAAAFHAWTWPNMLVWSYIGEHTPRHSFPLFPGIAGLAVLAFFTLLTTRPRLQRPLLISALALWFVMKIVFVEIMLPARAEDAGPGKKAKRSLDYYLWRAGSTCTAFKKKHAVLRGPAGSSVELARGIFEGRRPCLLPNFGGSLAILGRG